MTKREFFENVLKMKPSEIGTAVPFNPNGETEVTEEWLIAFIKNLWAERNKWHTGIPTEEGDYLLILKAPKGQPHYFTNTIKKDGRWRYVFRGEVIAWQKITPFEGEELDG